MQGKAEGGRAYGFCDGEPHAGVLRRRICHQRRDVILDVAAPAAGGDPLMTRPGSFRCQRRDTQVSVRHAYPELRGGKYQGLTENQDFNLSVSPVGFRARGAIPLYVGGLYQIM